MAIDLTKLDETTEPSELLKILIPWNDDENSRYRSLHHEWERNVLFYLGQQWLQDKQGVDGYVILQDDDTHFRPVANHTARLCDLKRSQVLGKLIRPKVMPNSDQKDDVDASRLGNLVLKAKHNLDSEDEINSLIFLHAQIFGTGWRFDFKEPIPFQHLEQPKVNQVKTEFFSCPTCNYIDPETTSCPQCTTDMEFHREVNEEAELDPQTGMPVVEKIPLYRNAVTVADPFSLKTSAATLEKDIKWITHSSIQQLSWINSTFDVHAEGFRPDQLQKVKKMNSIPRGIKISEDFKNAVSHSHSTLVKTITSNRDQFNNSEDTTILHRSYFAPSQNYPRGRLIFWTDTAVIYDGLPDIPNNPKIKVWHPATPFRYRKHPIRFEGIPYIESLIPLNKRYNALLSMVMEHLDKTASPERVEYGNVKKNNDDASDNTLVIDPQPQLQNGGAPFYLQHPQVSSEVYRMMDALIAEMEKEGNVTEVVQGMRPAGVDTYRGLQLLKDAADSSEGELYNSYYAYVRRASQLKLAIIQECLINQDNELTEMMEIIRQNENMGIHEVQMFTGQDLRNNLNISMEESDYLSQSKSAESDRIRGMMEANILSPEDLMDPYVKIQLLRKLGMSQLPFADKADIEKAERIIEIVESGDYRTIPKMLKHVDNKSLQLRVWSEWMKSSKFESLPEDRQQAAMQLLQMTETQLLQAQMSQRIPANPAVMNKPPVRPQQESAVMQ